MGTIKEKEIRCDDTFLRSQFGLIQKAVLAYHCYEERA